MSPAASCRNGPRTMTAGLRSTQRPTMHSPPMTRTENCGSAPGSKRLTQRRRPPTANIPSRLRSIVLFAFLALCASTNISASDIDNAAASQNGPGDKLNTAHNDDPMRLAACACPGWLAAAAEKERPARRLVRPIEVESNGPKQKANATAHPAEKR